MWSLSHCQQALEASMKTPNAKATGQYHHAVAGGSLGCQRRVS